MEAPRKSGADKKLILLVLGFLFGSAVVWGLSMWLLKVNIRKTVMLIITDRERLKALEPWAYQAQRHPLDYEDALARPQDAVGKPVVWEVSIPPDTRGPAFFEGSTSKPIRWVNPDRIEVYNGHGGDGRIFTVVGVISKAEKDGVTLQFLGYQ